MKKWLIALGITGCVFGIAAGLVCLVYSFPYLTLVIPAGIVFGVVLYWVKDSLD